MKWQTAFAILLTASVLLIAVLGSGVYLNWRLQGVRDTAQSHIYYGNTLENLPREVSQQVSEWKQTTETLVTHGVPEAFLQSGNRLYVFSSWTTICYFYVNEDGSKILGTYWTAT